MPLNFLLRLFLLLLSLDAGAQTKTVLYTPDDSDFTNPERGFYIPAEGKAGNFIPLDVRKLRDYRMREQKVGKASYGVKVTLIYRGYELNIFKNRPLSDSFLNSLQKDFDVIREAGLKMVLRFAYTNTARSGNCKGEYSICPPYGDASPEIVYNHIRQLTPILRKNADVIAVLQEGFIGIWGENYFTDYFGDASTSGAGRILDSSWQERGRLLKKLLEAMPSDRMVQVRTPQIKQKYVYGPTASVTSAALTEGAAFTGADAARIGFHNDCFLSGPNDYGTYEDYGSTATPRQPANEILRKYIEADTRYTVVGGETCDDAFSPQNDCAPAGHVEQEMRAMHYSFLNASYNTNVNNDWDSAGCMNSIKKRLGYRFQLLKAGFPVEVRKDQAFRVTLEIENAGYASPYNPRPVQLVLRNDGTGQVVTISMKTDLRRWFPGKTRIEEELNLPAGLPSGAWRLFLFLPDAASSLAGRPEYCIRLANAHIWEASSGYNDLNHTLHIK